MSGWTVLPLHRSLGTHRDVWDAMNDRSFGSNPLLSGLFIETLLQKFGDGTERLCVLEAGGTAQAMCIIKPYGHFAWTSFFPSQAQIGPTLIQDANQLPHLLKSLPSPTFALDLLGNDPHVGGVVREPSPETTRQNHALTMNVSLAGSFASYWANRSKNLQANIKRYRHRLQADSVAWRMEVIGHQAEMPGAVDRYANLEAAGWKGQAGTALPSDPEQLAFYLEVMQGAARDDQARVFELWFGDTLVASRLALIKAGVLVILKTTYMESMAQYSPGRLLLQLVIEYSFAEWPNGRIEFYTDANQDQLAWATEERWIQHATIFRWSFVELLLAARRIVAGHRQMSEAFSSKETEVFRHPDALPADAMTLLNRAERRNVELGAAWYRNLIDSVYPSNPGLRFYVLKHLGNAIAVLPLRAERVLLGWRLKSLSNYYTSLYEPALATGLKPIEVAALLPKIRSDFPGTASITLAPMDPSSHAYQTMLTAFRLRGWVAFEFFAFGNWYLPVTETWADYLATRSSTMRNTIKRMSKKFANDGGSLQIVSLSSELPAAIAAYEQVYAKSWKKPEPFPLFSPGLLATCASKGWLRLGLAWINGQPVAAQLWIVNGGRTEIYKVAYDEEFKRYSPGTLLTALLMEHVFEQDKVSEVDYLIGDDPYKATWMSHRRERWGIVAYNPRTIGGLLGLTRELVGRSLRRWLVRLGAWRNSTRSSSKT